MSEKYDVIIIGAGIGGLTCGCYLSKNGLKVLIIEQHSIPGGYCTSFQRKGYRFDVGIHYLSSFKRGLLGKILTELEVKNKLKINQFDPTDKIVMPDNVTYIRANPYDTILEFQKSFPKDKEKIEIFFKLLIETDIFSLIKMIKKLTFQEFLDAHFDNFRLKGTLGALLENMGTSPARVSALAAAIFFREFILDPGYYPEGGMQAFPDLLAEEIKKNGGELILSKKVSKIIIRDNKASGVILQDGSEFISKFVVSNADATLTYKELIGDSSIKELSSLGKLKLSNSDFALFIGLKINPLELLKEPANVWHLNSYDIEDIMNEPLNNIGSENPSCLVYSPSMHDPSIINNRHTIQVLVNAHFESEEFWIKNKSILAEKIFNVVKKSIPSFKDEYVDLKFEATPITFKRYTSNNGGAMYGWESSIERNNFKLFPQKSSLPGLFLAGHWCTSGVGGEGGITGVAAMGRNAARLILNELEIHWQWETLILK